MLSSSDYRGLKKLISAIKRAQESGQLLPIEEQSETPRRLSSIDGRQNTADGHFPPIARTSSKYGSTGETPPLVARNEVFVDESTEVPPSVELPSPALPLPHKQNKASVEFSVRSISGESEHASSRPRALRSKTDITVCTLNHIQAHFQLHILSTMTVCRTKKEHVNLERFIQRSRPSRSIESLPGTLSCWPSA